MPPSTQDLPALQAIARRQGGVVSDGDLRRCGFSADATARRVREGRWQRVGRATVITVATPAPTQAHDPAATWRRSAMAYADEIDRRWAHILQFTYGAGSLISGALALRRARWSLPAEELIIVAPHRVRHPIPEVTVLRRHPGRSTQIDRIAYADPADAFCDILITISAARRRDLVDAALQRRLMTAQSCADVITPRLGRGKTGATILREVLERVSSGSRSEAEQRMAALLARSGTGPWIPNHPVRGERHRVLAEIDFALLELQIAIEVDGQAFHSDRDSFEHDRARQNALTLKGWLVLRFTWAQITGDPAWVIATIRAAVHQRMRVLSANQPAG